jgi:hypothetical protein
MALNWIEEVEGLGSAPLTVQAQALSVDDVDPNSQLLHPVFFPAAPADSTQLQSIFETDKRYVADRREWNTRGRFIPNELPSVEKLSMLPIESYDKIGEEEQQRLREAALGNEAIYRNLVGASIPGRVNKLVAANFRRVEVDAMEAWSKGTITAKNPQRGTTQSLSLGFDAGRVQTAGTAWNNGGTNAYTDFLAWVADGESEMGPASGVVLRRAIFAAIQADSPNPIPGAQSGLKASRRLIEQVISDELGHEFKFFIVETQADIFTDGGTAVTRTAIWPSQYAALVPQSTVIGATYRAPVVRAMDLASQFPQAKIDVRGMTVFFEYENGGRTAVMECQANWLALPAERNIWTINTGVAS